jgi:hypothetical protein
VARFEPANRHRKMIELLQDPAYRHVLMNHMPITGLAVAWVMLVVAALLRHQPTLFAALALVAAMALSTVPVVFAGEDAYPFVYDTLDGDGRAWLDHHTHLAETWAPVLYANAALALLAIGLGVWRESLLRSGALAVALVTLAGLGAAGLISEAGGKIKHPEFRLSEPPHHHTSERSHAAGGH